MNYSERHKIFANALNVYHNINEQDVLNNPQNYFGPNYKESLNYWFYWKSLAWEQKVICSDRLHEIDAKTYNKAGKIAKNLALEVIDPRFVEHLLPVECEIISAHLYLERNIPFTFLPLIFDL
jgi:hypothetical protein